MAAAAPSATGTAGGAAAPSASAGAGVRDRWAPSPGDGDPWGGYQPQGLDLDLAAAGSGPGQELVTCSRHGRQRTKCNMIPDGEDGLTCKPTTPCLGSRGGTSKGPCPRDAESGLRVDQSTAGELLAAGPVLSDELIDSDLAELAACLQHPGLLNDRLRKYLQDRLARSGVNPRAAPGWWSAPGGRWGRLPSEDAILAAAARITLVPRVLVVPHNTVPFHLCSTYVALTTHLLLSCVTLKVWHN